MELPGQTFDKSALVVAHPDDEVLWFSSILDRVSRIVIVFGNGDRHAGLDEHIYRDKILTLDIEQVRSHNMSDWPHPEATDYGLRLGRDASLDEAYREQAGRVADKLEARLADVDNVFTHNPWGEYGHEAHVQVSKVATAWADKHDAATWYSNYASGKSGRLMRHFVNGFRNDYFTHVIDKARARQIADKYKRNGSWTFDADYDWFPEECFIRGPLEPSSQPAPGTLFPVNYIRVPFDPVKPAASPPGVLTRIRRRLVRALTANQRAAVNVAPG